MHGQPSITTVRLPATRRSGFTLIEAVMLVIVLAVIVLGVGTALQTIIRVPKNVNSSLSLSTQIAGKMEELRGLPYASLVPGTSLSDLANGITVTIANTDPTNPGGGSPDPDFKQVTVTIGGRSMTMYITNPS